MKKENKPFDLKVESNIPLFKKIAYSVTAHRVQWGDIVYAKGMLMISRLA